MILVEFVSLGDSKISFGYNMLPSIPRIDDSVVLNEGAVYGVRKITWTTMTFEYARKQGLEVRECMGGSYIQTSCKIYLE